MTGAIRYPLSVVCCEVSTVDGAAVLGDADTDVELVVVDGGSRDTDLVLAQGFPVFCAFLTPSDVVERWVPDRYGEPITIGTVPIHTGDFLLGDRDGVVIIPRDAVEEVVAKTEEVVVTESEMRAALISGMDPIEAYNRYGKF